MKPKTPEDQSLSEWLTQPDDEQAATDYIYSEAAAIRARRVNRSGQKPVEKYPPVEIREFHAAVRRHGVRTITYEAM